MNASKGDPASKASSYTDRHLKREIDCDAAEGGSAHAAGGQ
jgi:hypothetical protein